MARDLGHEARGLLLSALDDLDRDRERGGEVVDFVILTVVNHPEEREATHRTTGVEVDTSRRLGTLTYFAGLADHHLRETWSEDD